MNLQFLLNRLKVVSGLITTTIKGVIFKFYVLKEMFIAKKSRVKKLSKIEMLDVKTNNSGQKMGQNA